MACIRIGAHWFKRKGDAVKEIRRVLHEATLGQNLVGDDLDLIRALFAMHPGAADENMRKGIPLNFCVREHSFHGTRTRGFYALHLREFTAFSYLTCLDPRRSEPNLLAVMRASILLGQRRVKQEYYLGRDIAPCAYCKKDTAFKEAHVHHEPPKFQEIVDAFIADHGSPKCKSAALGDEFEDPADLRRWIAFHDACAARVVVCPACNYAAERQEGATE